MNRAAGLLERQETQDKWLQFTESRQRWKSTCIIGGMRDVKAVLPAEAGHGLKIIVKSSQVNHGLSLIDSAFHMRMISKQVWDLHKEWR